MTKHHHDAAKILPRLQPLSVSQRTAAARRLEEQLITANDNADHVPGRIDEERLLMLLDVLSVGCSCGCGRTFAEQFGLDLDPSEPPRHAPGGGLTTGGSPGSAGAGGAASADLVEGAMRAASAARRKTTASAGAGIGGPGSITSRPTGGIPNKGTALHNLWHLLWD